MGAHRWVHYIFMNFSLGHCRPGNTARDGFNIKTFTTFQYFRNWIEITKILKKVLKLCLFLSGNQLPTYFISDIFRFARLEKGSLLVNTFYAYTHFQHTNDLSTYRFLYIQVPNIYLCSVTFRKPST